MSYGRIIKFYVIRCQIVRASRDQTGVLALPLGDRDDWAGPPSRLSRIWGTATVRVQEGSGSGGGGAVGRVVSQEDIDFIAKEVKKRCPIGMNLLLV